MSAIVEKGAVRSLLNGSEKLPINLILYEIIDNRKHSKSEKVFIDINLHNRSSTVGYSEEATKENINNMVLWFNMNDAQMNADNIASKGMGLRHWEFRALGKWKHITYSCDKNLYYSSEINTADIYKAESEHGVSNMQFSEILHKSTEFVKEEEEVFLSIDNIFKNTGDEYPFQPKTIFRCNKLQNTNLLNDYLEEGKYNYDDLIKRLKIKYYKEIAEGFELYIKLPGYTEYTKIENDNVDIIGFTNNIINKLKIDIFITPEVVCYGYTFKIGENVYEFRKNGNSIIRQKVDRSHLNSPDFTLFQYNTNNISKEDKKNAIVGRSEEEYSGLYIEIGGTFINDMPVDWSITKRNLAGNKNYRAVMQCISSKSKRHLKLQGLKARCNLTDMPDLHNSIKCLTDVYKAYTKSMSDNSDDYLMISASACKTISPTKTVQGHFYIVELAKNFFKLGQSATQQRIFDYNTDKYKENQKEEFPDIDFYDNPHCRYLSLEKIKNVKVLELKVKALINESTLCQTYDEKNGEDIREYFLCNNNFEELYHKIINEINVH